MNSKTPVVLIMSEGGIIQDIDTYGGPVNIVAIDWDECMDGNASYIQDAIDALDAVVADIPTITYDAISLELQYCLEQAR